MKIDDHLKNLADAGDVCRVESLNRHRQALGSVLQADFDVSVWVRKIDGPAAEQIESARRELAFAEFSASSGLYRQAYSSLRLFLELSFAAVYFSVNELERRRWLADRVDFSWSQSLNGESGLLTKSFVREFAPNLVEDAGEFASKAAATYRHCSQFVHGKATHSGSLPAQVRYDNDVLVDWCMHATSAAQVVLFLLLVRYGVDCEAISDPDLQPVIIERFGHIGSIQDWLSDPED